MPTPRPTPERLKSWEEAINDRLRDGYRPLGQQGGKGSAIEETVRRLGQGSASTLIKYIRLGQIKPDWTLYHAPEQVAPPPLNIPKPATDPISFDRILSGLRKTPRTLGEIAEAAAVTKGQALDALEGARASGLNLHELDGKWSMEAAPPSASSSDNDAYVSRPDGRFVFGCVSDNHYCFPPATRIETETGSRPIASIKVGDRVLTHKNRLRAVSRVIVTPHDGSFVRVSFRGDARGGSSAYASLVATANHPVLVVRDGAEGFIAAGDIRPGDAVRYLSKPCAYCPTPVPIGMKVCKEHDPFVRQSRNGAREQRYKQHLATNGNRHFQDDILPVMSEWEGDGWRVIPIERVRPDFIAIKDGKVVAVEVEAPTHGFRPKPLYEKYDWADHRKYYDEVRWVEVDRRTRRQNRTYDWIGPNEHGFVGFVVSRVETIKARATKVYNLSVVEDESYVAKRCVVHNCSKYERDDVAQDLYDRFAKAGVDRVFNAGNWIDGEAPFNKFDLKVHGLEPQVRYLAKHYPQRNGIATYAIAGEDHEGWLGRREAIDIGRFTERIMREQGRKDWHNLGFMEAYVPLVHAETGVRSMLLVMHPGGGSSYATSYRPQKIVESLEGGEKPAVLLIGHYHKLSVNLVRNVWTLQIGCTQDQTVFMRKKNIDAHIGGMIVELEQDSRTGAIVGCKTEIIRYFNASYYNDRWSVSDNVTLPKRLPNRERAA